MLDRRLADKPTVTIVIQNMLIMSESRDMSRIYTVSTKRKYTLAAKYSKSRGARGKVAGCASGPTQWWVLAHPYFSSGPPQF